MEAMSGAETDWSGDKEGAVATTIRVESLLLAVLAAGASLGGRPLSGGGAGGCTDRDCGGCVVSAAGGRAFEGNSAALDARSKLGNRVGVRTWSSMVSRRNLKWRKS